MVKEKINDGRTTYILQLKNDMVTIKIQQDENIKTNSSRLSILIGL